MREGSKVMRARVYPRVGGGTSAKSPCSPPTVGLSPRGRGNLYSNPLIIALSGSIPAWAGEPALSMAHPRHY